MERPEERYYKLNRFLLKLSGLWPYQKARDALILRTFITILILSLLFVQTMSVLTSEITTDYLITVIQEISPAAALLCHLYIRIIHMDKLKELFDRMRNDWALQKTDNEIKIMHDYAQTSKSLSIRLTFLSYVGFVVYMLYLYKPDILDVISPMNESRPRKQYFKLQYFVPEEQYISLIRFHLFTVMFFMWIVFLANFTLFVTVAQHACGMCELLGYVDMIEHVHTIPFLMDLLELVFLLSITLAQILSISDNMELAIRSIGFANIQILYIGLCNYMGQQVLDKSLDIYDKVYSGAWYDAIVAQQKPLLLIMRRCFQPLMLTACKFCVMSLPNFARILQTTISYGLFIKQA